MKKMNLNSGINPVLILLVFGVDFCFGKNQPLNKVMRILKKISNIIILYILKRFSNLKSYQLIDIQNTIQDIYHLKRNNYISDLHEEEIEEIKYY